jgi:hypothetical protein
MRVSLRSSWFCASGSSLGVGSHPLSCCMVAPHDE